MRRQPADACRTRVSPASTFKIAHALAALDSGVASGPDYLLAYDGKSQGPLSWHRDHTLASAIHQSVVWYFQRLAQSLGREREQVYLQKFVYGNRLMGEELTHFWIDGSLQISPEEQVRFLSALFQDELAVSPASMAAVREMLRQPDGSVINAVGTFPFDQPWPAQVTVNAKTGSTTERSGRAVRWLVGQVQRGQRRYVFVSCVIGSPALDGMAAIDLAARALREERIL